MPKKKSNKTKRERMVFPKEPLGANPRKSTKQTEEDKEKKAAAKSEKEAEEDKEKKEKEERALRLLTSDKALPPIFSAFSTLALG
jgi:hypothetical protein